MKRNDSSSASRQNYDSHMNREYLINDLKLKHQKKKCLDVNFVFIAQDTKGKQIFNRFY